MKSTVARSIVVGCALFAGGADARAQLTTDSSALDTYLKASNTGDADFFGSAMAISGDTLVVGAPGEDGGNAGVDAFPFDDSREDAGGAYVLVREAGAWTLQAYLKASNPDEFDRFGWSVAISGDTIVVGAPGEASWAGGVDGDQSNNSMGNAGAAYVFVRDGGTWTQQAYLKASNTQTNDEFAGAVSISGDTIVVGANREDSASTGVNGTQGNAAGSSGAAYVFVRDGSSWSQQAYLKASNTEASDFFGTSVLVVDDTVVVGAIGEDSAATGMNGDQSDNSASSAGALYVFTRSGADWSQQAYLKSSNPGGGDNLGSSLALSGDTLVAGAAKESSSATGVDGDGSDDGALWSGAAYVFVRDGSAWNQQAYLKASNTGSMDYFGGSVAVSGDVVVVGADQEDSSATGVDGPQDNNGRKDSGAAYLFVRDGTSWSQLAYLKSPDSTTSNPFSGDEFGRRTLLDGDTLVVSAPQEDSGATGIDGDMTDNSAQRSGAGYVFDLGALLEPSAFRDLGFALAGVAGEPRLEGSGDLAPAASNTLTLSDAAPSAFAGLFAAVDPVTPTAFRGGTLVPFPFATLKFTTTSPAGEVPLGFVTPPGLPSGLVIYAQWAVSDAAALLGVSLSNAVQGSVP